MQSFVTRGGNCGELEGELVSFDKPAGPAGGGGCTVTGERWSENDCKLDRTVSCTFPDSVMTFTAVTRQQTANGSTIGGTFSVSARFRDGSSCSGTYDVTSVRQ
jgi:hypothetical protein